MSLAGRALRRGRREVIRAARAGRDLVWPTTDGVPRRVVDAKRDYLAHRRTFGPADLDALARLAQSAAAVLPIREAIDRARAGAGLRLIAMRHDMDHDLENSVRFAEWEAAREIRATYYVLHTDWYWGDRPDRPSQLLVRGLDRIARLGHEIGVHNNALTVALQTGRDPVEVLDQVIGGLRRRGFDITGTVAHGDPLCHAIGYINYEVFTECPNATHPEHERVLVHHDPTSETRHEIRLQPIPMAQLGLSYEANFIGQTMYLTDTGGHWNMPFATAQQRFVSENPFLQILAHPVWWAFRGEPVRPREPSPPPSA